MNISIPLTGTLISYQPTLGDLHDPVRPIELNLGNVSWRLISLDLEYDLALVEVTAAEEQDFDTGRLDQDSKPIYERRRLTEAQKQGLLDNVKSLLLDNSVDKLYELSKSPRLRKPQVSPKSKTGGEL